MFYPMVAVSITLSRGGKTSVNNWKVPRFHLGRNIDSVNGKAALIGTYPIGSMHSTNQKTSAVPQQERSLPIGSKTCHRILNA